jgi:hypothetical protein
VILLRERVSSNKRLLAHNLGRELTSRDYLRNTSASYVSFSLMLDTLTQNIATEIILNN